MAIYSDAAKTIEINQIKVRRLQERISYVYKEIYINGRTGNGYNDSDIQKRYDRANRIHNQLNQIDMELGGIDSTVDKIETLIHKTNKRFDEFENISKEYLSTVDRQMEALKLEHQQKLVYKRMQFDADLRRMYKNYTKEERMVASTNNFRFVRTMGITIGIVCTIMMCIPLAL